MEQDRRMPAREVTNEDLFFEMLSQGAHIKAHLETLFMMQCELFAHVNKASSTAIAETWGEVRQQFLKENLESINEHLSDFAKHRR